jgi:nitrate reductase NapE component
MIGVASEPVWIDHCHDHRWPQDTLGYFAIPISAYGGGNSGGCAGQFTGEVGPEIHNTTLILAGVAVSSFSNAVTSFLLINAGGELRRAIVWMMGGSTLIGWKPVLAASPYILLGILLLCSTGYQLNVLQFGDEEAQQMGVPVKKVRIFIILAATLTTAAAVAFAGTIAFVGWWYRILCDVSLATIIEKFCRFLQWEAPSFWLLQISLRGCCWLHRRSRWGSSPFYSERRFSSSYYGGPRERCGRAYVIRRTRVIAFKTAPRFSRMYRLPCIKGRSSV